MAADGTPPGRPDDRAPRYRVTAVERMTRIPASTLRAWERRYGLPRPSRAATGQRLYSDQDVAVIRFLDRRRIEGMSVSQAAGLLPSTPAVEDHDPARLLARLVAALRDFDEPAADRAFVGAEALLGVEAVAASLVPAAIAAASARAPTPARRRRKRRSRSSTSPPTCSAATCSAYSTGCRRRSGGPCWSAAAPTSSTSSAPC
jgi:DNA-binding transcriptional MerR regulator